MLEIYYNCTTGRIPSLLLLERNPAIHIVHSAPTWKIPLSQKLRRDLHPELISLAESGTGRPDKLLNLVTRYYSEFVSDDEKFTLRMLLLTWVGILDKTKPEEKRYHLEAYPVTCIGGTFGIKQGEDQQTGILQSWTVFSNGTGVCILRDPKDAKDKEITFGIDDLMSDPTMIKVIQKPVLRSSSTLNSNLSQNGESNFS